MFFFLTEVKKEDVSFKRGFYSWVFLVFFQNFFKI